MKFARALLVGAVALASPAFAAGGAPTPGDATRELALFEALRAMPGTQQAAIRDLSPPTAWGRITDVDCETSRDWPGDHARALSDRLVQCWSSDGRRARLDRFYRDAGGRWRLVQTGFASGRAVSPGEDTVFGTFDDRGGFTPLP